MKRICTLLLSIILLIALFPPSFTASALSNADGEYVLDEIIIKFHPRDMFPDKEKQYDDEVSKILKDGLSIVSENVYVVRSEDFKKNPNATLNQYKNSDFIDYVEPNYILTAEETPNDPSYKSISAILNALNAPAGWDIITGGGPVIAVVDTGYATHSDLPAAQNGYSAVSSLAYSNDKKGHGTQVSGVVGAIANNGLGTAGVNWNAQIMAVKVDDANGVMTTSNVAIGIRWAADNGASIINLSLGSQSQSVTMKNAVDYAYNKGCVIIAAAGNEGVNGVSYPARYSNVLAVGSSTNGVSKAAGSNYGAGLDVVGVGTYYTTRASGGYTTVGGTSFAAPQAAALASLMMEINPGLTAEEIYSYIRQSAKPLGGGYNDQTGYGLIDIGRTLELVRAEIEPIPEPEPVPEPERPTDLQGGVKSFLIEAAKGDRDDYNGSVGYEFECLEDMTVSYIGRPLNGEMKSSHSVYIWDVKTKSILASAEVSPDSPVDALGFKVAQLSDPIALKAGETYRIVSAETIGGDKWYDISQPGSLIPNVDCCITTAVYTPEGAHSSYPENTYSPGGNKGYVGVTFYYALDSDISEPVTPTKPEYNTPPTLTLNGSKDITSFVGEEYVETGYKAVDCYGLDITGAVRVTSGIDIWTPGIYQIDYVVEDAGGNTARETRTVHVIEKEVEPPPANAPTLTIIGSDPIILHLDSGTPYIEQGAVAYDELDGDISDMVQISGSVDRDRAGTYTITYSVVNSAGLESTATRDVRVIAPEEVSEPSIRYNFSGQGKSSSTTTHKNIIIDNAGYMDFRVTSLDKSMTIKVDIVDQDTGSIMYRNTFTGVGGTQFWADEGRYDIKVTITAANGNSKYSISVVTPETIHLVFEEDEIPLSSPELIKRLIDEGYTPLEICLSFDLEPKALNEYYGYFIAAGWDEADLARFGLEGVIESDEEESPLPGEPDADRAINHVVAAGDTLYKIARKYLGDGSRWQEIYDMNKDVIGENPNMICPGQVLRIGL